MRTAIVDYGSGNLHSARKAFERVVAENALRQEIVVTDDPVIVAGADRIVLPGVGAFADCRRGLFAVSGMVEALSEAVIAKARPFLGICVGMQLMASRGLEHETSAGLDWIAGDVARIEPAKAECKVPHMGWNSLSFERPHALFAEFALAKPFAYFVHSYHFIPKNAEHRLASSDHGGAISAIVGRDNLVGTQFHPEKSQAFGLAFIRAFLSWRP